MAKEMVIVWLTGIEYAGEEVGSNTQFSISVNGHEPISISTDVKLQTTRLFQKPVFMQLLDSGKEEISVIATVIEEDLAVDDRGQSAINHKLQPVSGRQSLPVVTVNVTENRGLLGKGKTATFRLHFEAER